MEITIPYYEDNTRISNSAIGWFLKNGPSFLHKKLEGLIPDEKGSQLERGTMIHEYILQPEEFQKDYVVCPDGVKKPASDKQEAFCRKLIDTTEIEPNKQLLEAYKACYSIVGKSEAKMLLEATEMANTLNDYIRILKDGRIIISASDYKKCISVKEHIDEHKFASVLLDNKDWEEHHEFHINWEVDDVKCKSLLDCVKFDFAQKKCQLIDLKTTVKLWHFEDSIQMYDYMRQLCFYSMAIYWYLKNEKNEDPAQWSMEFYIVGIDSTKDSDIRVFKFTEDQVYSRFVTITTALSDIKWHQETGKWEHTKDYYEGDGCECLEL